MGLITVALAIVVALVLVGYAGSHKGRPGQLRWARAAGVTRGRDGVVAPINEMTAAEVPPEVAEARRFLLVRSPGRFGAPVEVTARGHRIGVLEGQLGRAVAVEMRRHGASQLLVSGELTGRFAGHVVLPEVFADADPELPARPPRAFPVPVPVEPWGSAAEVVDAVRSDFFLPEIEALYPDGRPPAGTAGRTLSGIDAEIFPSGSGRIGVFVADRQIGWLAAAQEASHGAVLEELAAGGNSLKVRASARVGVGNRPSVRVRVWLPDVAQILPPEPLPEGRHVLLPPGQRIQVTAEEEHLSDLVAFLGEQHEATAVAELRMFTRATARTEHEIVGVRIGGRPVGELTRTSGAHFEAVLRVCAERGITVLCRATVTGNQLKADVVLNVAKGGSLTSEWIESHILTEPGPGPGQEGQEGGVTSSSSS